MTAAHIASILAIASMAPIARRRLLANGYSSKSALGIAACFLVLSSVCLLKANSLVPILLGCGIYAVCASTFSLAREQSIRGIIRAGGALAGAQIVVPFGGLFISMLLPALIGLPKSQNAFRKSLGILLLLLFMPAVAAVVLAVMHFKLDSAAPANSSFIFGAVLLLLFAAFATAGFRFGQWTGFIPLLTGLALSIATAAGDATGEARSPRELVPALAAILLVAVSEWPHGRQRGRRAFALFAAAIVSTLFACEAGLL